jgi:nucleoside-diphosphate-sugar epimerase
VRIFIIDCGGVLGVPLIRWLLEHSDASMVGSDRYHERLAELLRLPRLTYYAFGEQEEPELLRELIANSDVVVDLSSIEQRNGHLETVGELQEKLRRQTSRARECRDANVPLIHVSSADVYGPIEPNGRTMNGRGQEDQPLHEDEALMVADPVDRIESARQNSERMIQQLIYAYGTSGDLDYAVLRIFDTLSSELDMLPIRSTQPLLTQVRNVMLRGEGGALTVNRDDRRIRTFVYVEDVAACIGQMALDPVARSSRQVVNVGNPANQDSAYGVAQRLLDRYEQRAGADAYVRPTFHQFGASGNDRLRRPSIDRARELLGWEPRWSLDAMIDAILDRLIVLRANPTGTEPPR